MCWDRLIELESTEQQRTQVRQPTQPVVVPVDESIPEPFAAPEMVSIASS